MTEFWCEGVLGERKAECPPGCMRTRCKEEGHRSVPVRVGKTVGQAVTHYWTRETWVELRVGDVEVARFTPAEWVRLAGNTSPFVQAAMEHQRRMVNA